MCINVGPWRHPYALLIHGRIGFVFLLIYLLGLCVLSIFWSHLPTQVGIEGLADKPGWLCRFFLVILSLECLFLESIRLWISTPRFPFELPHRLLKISKQIVIALLVVLVINLLILRCLVMNRLNVHDVLSCEVLNRFFLFLSLELYLLWWLYLLRLFYLVVLIVEDFSSLWLYFLNVW